MNKYERIPEHIIDLHGYNTRQAGELLDEAIESGGYKHIRVITGKGTLHEGPVMRTFVTGHLSRRNIEFRTSKLADGGEGALEVYM